MKLNDFKTMRISANYKWPVKKRIKSYVAVRCPLISFCWRKLLYFKSVSWVLFNFDFRFVKYTKQRLKYLNRRLTELMSLGCCRRRSYLVLLLQIYLRANFLCHFRKIPTKPSLKAFPSVLISNIATLDSSE